MDNSDTVMLTYRNPDSLVKAGTAEAGTAVLSRGLVGHAAEGYSDALMSLESMRQNVNTPNPSR